MTLGEDALSPTAISDLAWELSVDLSEITEDTTLEIKAQATDRVGNTLGTLELGAISVDATPPALTGQPPWSRHCQSATPTGRALSGPSASLPP